jgi:hypothetical protein
MTFDKFQSLVQRRRRNAGGSYKDAAKAILEYLKIENMITIEMYDALNEKIKNGEH